MDVVDPAERAALEAVDAQLIALSDARYPPLLREIHDPPERLYVRGDPALLSRPQLAIVGARRASAVALRIAETFAAAAVGAGLQVCSGLAQGIDGAAHRGALAGQGTTVAVMGTGINAVYPAVHTALADDIVASGCLVSEFPPGTPPRRQNFPQRNRIISGLSLGVLVIEAALPSGSLITARTALEQGREVFALPWSIAHQGGAGCLHLLRDGARMVLTIEDVLQELGSLYGLQLQLLQGEAVAAALDSDAPALLQLLGYEELGLDALVSRSGLPVAELMSQLSSLELAGAIVRGPGGYMRS
jgi:DNA processing protein